MGRLDLKHLAPYLPYGIKLQYTHTGEIGQIRNIYDISDYDTIKIAIDYKDGEHIWMFKPLLRPLSDIQDTSYKWKEMASEMALSNNDDYLIQKDINSNQYLSYSFQTWLISNHFDVFGLIEQGLAIDINTLSNAKH